MLANRSFVLGASTDNRLEATSLGDLIVGGDGIDTAIYSGAFNEFRFTAFGDDLLVDSIVAGESDLLMSIERIRFDDITLPTDWVLDNWYNANSDSYVIDEDSAIQSGDSNVTWNDTSGGDADWEIVLTGAPNAATFVMHSDGRFDYAPDPNYSGNLTFAYDTRLKFLDDFASPQTQLSTFFQNAGASLDFVRIPLGLEIGESYQLSFDVTEASGAAPISLALNDGTIITADLRGSMGTQILSFTYDGASTGLAFDTGVDGILDFDNFTLVEQSTGDILVSTNIFSGDAQTILISVEAVADQPELTVAPTSTSEDETSLSVAAALLDNDGSESLRLTVTDIPEGFRVTDGFNEFVATSSQNSVDITAWDSEALRLIAPASLTESATDLSIQIVASATEGANGDSISTTATVVVFAASDTLFAPPVEAGDDSLIPRGDDSNLTGNQNDTAAEESTDRADSVAYSTGQATDSSDSDNEELSPTTDDGDSTIDVELSTDAERQQINSRSYDGDEEDNIRLVSLYLDRTEQFYHSEQKSTPPPPTEEEAGVLPTDKLAESTPKNRAAAVSNAVLRTATIGSYIISPHLPVATAFNSGKLWQAMDSVVEDSEAIAATEKVVAGVGVVLVVGFSTGQLLWLLRGTTLIAKLMTSMPIWISFDPLPLLDALPELPTDPQLRNAESLAEIAGAVNV